MTELEYLEEERKKLWEKLLEVEKMVELKSSDYEKEAKQHSRKASEYRNRCEESKNTSFEFLNQIKENLEITNSIHSEFSQLKKRTNELYTISNEKNKFIIEFAEKLEERKESLEKNITTLEELFGKEETYVEDIKTLESLFAKGEEVDSKITTLHKSVLTKKKEIDDFYRDIFGYTELIENNEEVSVEGLKDKLENAFEELESNLKEFGNIINEKLEFTTSAYDDFVQKKSKDFDDVVNKWDMEYQAVLVKIEGLLPNALTTGLSYAYSEKKKDEIKDSEKYSRRFMNAAIGLVFVSLIPFAVSIVSWMNDKTIQEVIYDMPRLVLAILPLYAPVLWLAYSANKKLNLSKRLIEEYTHKEVLSKTFEGLSTQIDNIADMGLSADLKIKLLSNIVSISSENPGKLISDYNKSDHPLTDALEQSVKLANAVEKLSDFPGLKRITTLLARKSEKIIDTTAQKVKDGLDYLNTNSDRVNENG